MTSRFPRTALLAGAALLFAPAAMAQGNNPAWFIPGQTAAPRPAARAGAPRPAPEPSNLGTGPAAAAAEAPPEPLQAQLPPMPPVPEVARGAMPPAAVIGVLSIQDALRAASAYREADKVLAERREKLNADAQKEEGTLRDLGQQLATDRAKLTAEQIRTKERALQDRITESRRRFTERGRIIQEASQYALAQLQRTLSEVVQRVAASRGMNIVLQRAEVVLNQGEFDITAQVAELLNKALPTVVIPPDGVAPPALPATASAAPNAATAAMGAAIAAGPAETAVPAATPTAANTQAPTPASRQPPAHQPAHR